MGERVSHQQIAVFVVDARFGNSDERQQQGSAEKSGYDHEQYCARITGEYPIEPPRPPERYMDKADQCKMGYLPDSGGYYMLWFRTADNRFVRDWCHRDRLLDKAVEEFATTSGRPPVEPECEFVQV